MGGQRGRRRGAREMALIGFREAVIPLAAAGKRCHLLLRTPVRLAERPAVLIYLAMDRQTTLTTVPYCLIPDIFLAAARKLSLAPDQCVVIEDAVNGIQAAKAAGMRCVAVAQTFPADKLLAADLVRPDLQHVGLDDLIG